MEMTINIFQQVGNRVYQKIKLTTTYIVLYMLFLKL